MLEQQKTRAKTKTKTEWEIDDMENFKKELLARLDELESYTAKADCIETVELTLRVLGVYEQEKEIRRFVDEQWYIINEMEMN